MSISHDRLLLLKNASVNGNLDFVSICKQRHVYIGYWTQDQYLKVNKGSLQKKSVTFFTLGVKIGFVTVLD